MKMTHQFGRLLSSGIVLSKSGLRSSQLALFSTCKTNVTSFSTLLTKRYPKLSLGVRFCSSKPKQNDPHVEKPAETGVAVAPAKTEPVTKIDKTERSDTWRGLMEFFDDEENWGASQVRVGRSWRLEELRLKSNTDLHKLWFVLLRERNMLLTMEQEYDEEYKAMPNPERIDKVKEGMDNLETVVKERNKAYWELETGETGVPPSKYHLSALGMRYTYRAKEHKIPFDVHTAYHKRLNTPYFDSDVRHHTLLMSQQNRKIKRQAKTRRKNEAAGVLKRFPGTDPEAFKAKYSEFDMDDVRGMKKARGHHTENT